MPRIEHMIPSQVDINVILENMYYTWKKGSWDPKDATDSKKRMFFPGGEWFPACAGL